MTEHNAFCRCEDCLGIKVKQWDARTPEKEEGKSGLDYLIDLQGDAVFMASVWKLYGDEFRLIVDRLQGDSSGIDFVTDRILMKSDA